MIHTFTLLASLLLAAASTAHAQFQHRVPMTPERLAESHRRTQAYADGEKARVRARNLLDAGDPRAVIAFDDWAQIYASVPDPSSEAEVQAEWSFECGDYPEVMRLSAKINQIEGHRPALLRLAISECRTGHPEMALPRLAQWRAMEYCGSGEMPEIDLPVEAALDARSVQATAWLLLAFDRERSGRPALGGLLEAQRLARRNLPLLSGSKSAEMRSRQVGISANLDRLERRAKAKQVG